MLGGEVGAAKAGGDRRHLRIDLDVAPAVRDNRLVDALEDGLGLRAAARIPMARGVHRNATSPEGKQGALWKFPHGKNRRFPLGTDSAEAVRN